jgi:hypothetical protein
LPGDRREDKSIYNRANKSQLINMENLVIKPNELAQLDQILQMTPFRYAAPIVNLINQITNLRLQEEAKEAAQAFQQSDKKAVLGAFSKKQQAADNGVEPEADGSLGGLTGGLNDGGGN